MTDDAAKRFELLYRQHFRAVLRYTLARVEPETARDATAETFLVAWRRLPEVPDDPAPWLFAVARKVIATQLRSRSRREALHERLASADADRDCPAEIGEDVVERSLVRTAFAGLSDNDREALMLVAWDGLSAKTAAGVLGVTQFAFGVRLHRARRRLSAALAAADPPAPPSEPESSGLTAPRHPEPVSFASPKEVR